LVAEAVNGLLARLNFWLPRIRRTAVGIGVAKARLSVHFRTGQKKNGEPLTGSQQSGMAERQDTFQKKHGRN
jgi:hypothetical protein